MWCIWWCFHFHAHFLVCDKYVLVSIEKTKSNRIWHILSSIFNWRVCHIRCVTYTVRQRLILVKEIVPIILHNDIRTMITLNMQRILNNCKFDNELNIIISC
jgi:hypothetical protein